MTDQDYWEKFVKTGNVYDYLNYTACTRQDKYGQMTGSYKEGEPKSGDYNSDRNGPEGYANR
ncbi:MAG: hypothetical protein GX995_01875 [Clostridiales bacterium]|jgi:hypothetical protein|nr:hypothetical protein [Clostridiales bacterium]